MTSANATTAAPAMMGPPPIFPLPTLQSNTNSSRCSSRASSSPKRKRTEDSSATSTAHSSGAAFSASVRERVMRHYDFNRRCWHCSAQPVDVCHVIGKRDDSVGVCGSLLQVSTDVRSCQFATIRAQSFLNIPNPGDFNNAILLCPLCHRNFDDYASPGFVVIPSDINFFMQWERKDQERRWAMRRDFGQRTTRICPGPDNYAEQCASTAGGVYRRFTVQDYFSQLRTRSGPGIGELVDEARWHGDPMATLRRTFLALGNMAVEGIPREVRTQLRQLQALYEDGDAEELNQSVEEEDDTGNGAGNRDRQDGSNNSEDSQSGHRNRHAPSIPDQTSPNTEAGAQQLNPVASAGSAVHHQNLDNPSPKRFRSSDVPQKSADLTAIQYQDLVPALAGNVGMSLPLTPSMSADDKVYKSKSVNVSEMTTKNDVPMVKTSSLTSSKRLASLQQGTRSGSQRGPWTWGPQATAMHAIDFFSSAMATSRNGHAA